MSEPPESTAPVDPIVRLDDVGKTYSYAAAGSAANGAVALEHVDLSVMRGEILGIVGESGAGKSTVLGVLTGAIAPTSGRAHVLGDDVAALDGRRLRALRRRLGVMFQSVDLLANRTVRQNVETPLRLRGIARAERSEARRRVDEMLRFVGLADRSDAFPAQLSGGQRQRVGIARALVSDPQLLLCDEPTSSLDAATSESVLDLLRDARDRLGTTIVIVTHDLSAVRRICDRVALFERGRLVDVLAVPPHPTARPLSYRDRVRRELGS